MASRSQHYAFQLSTAVQLRAAAARQGAPAEEQVLGEDGRHRLPGQGRAGGGDPEHHRPAVPLLCKDPRMAVLFFVARF